MTTMKIIYEIKDVNSFLSQLTQIAQKYNTVVKEYDEEPGYFIFIKNKIKIYEVSKDNKKLTYVWGATDEDVSFLTSFWGPPIKKIELKMTPLQFASELVEIPQVDRITKEEIIEILEISDRDFIQYSRYIKMASRKKDIPKEVQNANKILEKF